MSETAQLTTFRYEAQTRDGHTLSGQLDADSAEAAQSALSQSGLAVIEIERASRPARARRLGGADFATFNQQLAQLTQAGLPIEEGLRLIAQDMPGRGTAAAVQQVADDIEAGTPLDEAFERHQANFPPLYGRLIRAGVQSHQLPAVLFSLGRHLELLQRLRATLWRAAAYPMVVLIAVAALLAFMGQVIVPPFRAMFADFDVQLPILTKTVLASATWTPIAALVVAGVVVLGVCLWLSARATGRAQAFVDYVLMPVPLIGAILKRNLAARWCDALRLGVDAGLDLPDALALAGDVTASPKAQADSRTLIETVESGQMIRAHAPLQAVPSAVPAAIQLGAERRDLGGVLADLARMYHQQAEFRMQAMQTLMTPILLALLTVVIGTVTIGLFLPLVTLMQSLM